MENLKNTINKTETLLNNVKLVKNKINETIVRGGGITSKSLSEIPDNIKSMISKNYKKIAIINSGINIPSQKLITVSINLNFTPSIIIADIDNLSGNDFSINSLNQNNYNNGIYIMGCAWWIQDITKEKFNIVTGGGSPSENLKLKSIIAIE